jgi:hypothetical protein
MNTIRRLFDWVFCLETMLGRITCVDVRHQQVLKTGDLALNPDNGKREQRLNQ